MIEKSTLPPPPIFRFLKICGHLLRCCAQINPQRITSGTDTAGSKLQQVFCQKNLSLNSVHGRTLFNMPAVNLCSRLVSASPIFKKAYLKGQTVNLNRLFAKKIIIKKQTESLFSKNISAMDGGGSKCASLQRKLEAEKCTRTYIFQRGCPSSPKTPRGLRGLLPL